MDIIFWGNFLLIPIAAVEFILALYILVRKTRSEISISFGLFALFVAFWVFSNGFGYISVDESLKWFWWNFTFIAALFILATFLLFSWVFPFKEKIITIKNYLILFVPTIIFILVIIFTDLFIKGFEYEAPYQIFYGSAYHLFAFYFIAFWGWAFINLYKKFRHSDGIHRWQLKYLLIGVIISSAFGITTNLLLPWIGQGQVNSYDFIGPASSVAWLGFASYIIFRKTRIN
ncbi:histidine kinase N-terminal 7TM domain-containing protein [Patescibacteria group bacterium]